VREGEPTEVLAGVGLVRPEGEDVLILFGENVAPVVRVGEPTIGPVPVRGTTPVDEVAPVDVAVSQGKATPLDRRYASASAVTVSGTPFVADGIVGLSTTDLVDILIKIQ